MNYFAEQKKETVKRMKNYVSEEGKIGKDKLIAEVALDEGLTEDTVKGYVDQLIKAEKIEETDNEEIKSVE